VCVRAVPCCALLPHARCAQVEGVSNSSPTYASLAVFMVVLCVMFVVSWLTVVAVRMYQASVRRPDVGTAAASVVTRTAPATGKRALRSNRVERIARGADDAEAGKAVEAVAVAANGSQEDRSVVPAASRMVKHDTGVPTAVNPLFVRMHRT
jgi:hypothetical protein